MGRDGRAQCSWGLPLIGESVKVFSTSAGQSGSSYTGSARVAPEDAESAVFPVLVWAGGVLGVTRKCSINSVH